MKNIYLVQANAIYGDSVKNTYIPYAIGCLAAFAYDNAEIRNEYKLGKFIYTRTDIKKAVAELENPFLVGFSTSVWNSEYNKAFAKELKAVYPDCKTVFGGHQIPPDGEEAFAEYPDADIFIHSAGEEAFRDILLALKNDTSLYDIPNISTRYPDQKVYNGERLIPDTPDYPSPYLTGIFDPILNDGIEFSAIIETNRGCPNKCAFCDWGALKSKIKLFSLEKIQKELKWLSEHKIEYVYCADANFGIFDRDMDITDMFIELKETTGYPQKLKVNFTKNRCEFVGEISSKLSRYGIGKSQTLSFQSVDEKVLHAIGRKNIDLEHFRELLKMYEKEDIPTYSELILGLPEETYESFTDGICTLIENGQHKSINVYPCELLPNSLLGSKEYKEKYNIRTTLLPFGQFHCEKEDSGVIEYSRLITSTSSITKEDWVDSYFFATVVQAFHCLGIIRETAMYMRNEKGISYKNFYSRLIDFAFSDPDSYIGQVFSASKEHLRRVADARDTLGIYDSRFGSISYEPDENLFLSSVYETYKLYCCIFDFLKEFIGFDTAEALTDCQRASLYIPHKSPEQISVPFSIAKYFTDILPENIDKNTKVTIRFSPAYDINDFSQYARISVWYGRRNEGTKNNREVVL